jgi:hypothetical protein
MPVAACNSVICPSTSKSSKIGDFGHALENKFAAGRTISAGRLGFRPPRRDCPNFRRCPKLTAASDPYIHLGGRSPARVRILASLKFPTATPGRAHTAPPFSRAMVRRCSISQLSFSVPRSIRSSEDCASEPGLSARDSRRLAQPSRRRTQF